MFTHPCVWLKLDLASKWRLLILCISLKYFAFTVSEKNSVQILAIFIMTHTRVIFHASQTQRVPHEFNSDGVRATENTNYGSQTKARLGRRVSRRFLDAGGQGATRGSYAGLQVIERHGVVLEQLIGLVLAVVKLLFRRRFCWCWPWFFVTSCPTKKGQSILCYTHTHSLNMHSLQPNRKK